MKHAEKIVYVRITKTMCGPRSPCATSATALRHVFAGPSTPSGLVELQDEEEAEGSGKADDTRIGGCPSTE